MSELSESDLRNALKSVGLEDGDSVFVHSSLYRLGRIEGVEIDEMPEVVTDILLDILGPNGGIYVPTFTFSFCDGEPFDIRSTPSEMGVLSEYIRQHKDSIRSPHPMQSIAGIGYRAEETCKRDTRTAYSADGPIEHLYDRGAKVLCLGVPFMSSPLHYVEEQCEVPYRYWKEFEGEYTDRSGKTRVATYEMYVRDLDLDPTVEEDIVKDNMSEDEIKKETIGSSQVISFTFEDHFRTAFDLVRDDPFALVSEMNESSNDE